MEKPLVPIKYFIYCRKSSEDDGRQILSLESQEKEMRRLAEQLNLGNPKLFRESQSAKAPGRKTFNDMIARIERGEAQGLLCWKLDRLARNFIDGGRIIDMLQRGTIREIQTYERKYLPTDNVLMMAVELGTANQFIKDLSSNTKRGLRMKIEMGQPPTYAPTGYLNDLITHNWVPDPVRAPFVIQAFEMYDSGQYSVRQLTERLHRAGFTTRNNKPVAKSVVGTMLRRHAYYGHFISKGELKRGAYKALVSKEQWDRVQDRLEGRITYKDRKNKLVFKYRGFLFCGECGCSITAERKKGHVYYRCTKSKGFCSQAYLREEELETQLLDIFERVQLNKGDVGSIHGQLLAFYEEDQRLQGQTLKNLRTKLTLLEEEKKKIYRKLVLSDGDIDREIVLELKQDVESKIKAIQDQVDQLADNSYSWLEQSSNLLQLATQAKELFQKATFEQKRELLDFVSSNRILRDKKLAYTLNKPFAVAAEIKAGKAVGGENDDDRPIWLRDLDSNQGPSD